jgi:dihydrofolate reductase
LKTQYYTASSLDGYIAAPGHSLDWLFQFGSIEDTGYPEFIKNVGALAMGSSTYEWILRHQMGPEGLVQWPYSQPVWVFSSRSLPAVDGAAIQFVRGDVRPVHREMVAAAGSQNIWIVGGGDLVGQFYDQGLLDEIIVQIAPVTLGAGSPLLPRAITDPPLRFKSARLDIAGFAELTLEILRRP